MTCPVKYRYGCGTNAPAVRIFTGRAAKAPFDGLRVVSKSEARNPKYKTNSNYRNINDQNERH